MPMRLFYFIPIVALLISACSPEKEAPVATATADSWLPLSINGVSLEAQIVITAPEQQRGLMYRESLPPESGMLFPYPVVRQMSFWMANTPLPLDIGFFDSEGVLLEIHRMVPYDTKRTISRSSDVQYALEMSSGWFSGKELFPGVKLDLTSLAEALSKRGVDPAQYGLPPDN